MTTIDPLACTLALTLLPADEACPVCGYLASEHRGWQREHGRGGLPASPRVLRCLYCLTVKGNAHEEHCPYFVNVDDHPAQPFVAEVITEHFPGMPAPRVVSVTPPGIPGTPPLVEASYQHTCEPSQPALSAETIRRETAAEPVAEVPHAWLVMGRALELIPAGAVVELDPAVGHVRCHRAPARKSPSEDQPSPSPEDDPPPSDV